MSQIPVRLETDRNSLFDELEVRFGKRLTHLREYFCAAEVVVAAIGCAFEGFLVFG